MWADFVHKLENARSTRESNIFLMLNPRFDALPLPITRMDDPFLPFGKAIIQATQDLVCGYVFDLASYLALGAAGAIALERTIRYVGQDTITILHGPFTGIGYTAMADATGFGIDALTLTNQDDMGTYLDKPPYAAFVVQKGAVTLDTLPEQGGYFWPDCHRFALKHNGNFIELRLTDNSILYAGKLDDFAQKTRDAVSAIR